MSNYDYIDKDFDLEHVSVTFFKPHGKYYSQDELDFTGVFDCEYIDWIDSTLAAYQNTFGKIWSRQMHLIVMNHPYGFPVMIPANNPHENGYWRY
ncbi:hypothetical protein PBI_GRAYSON_254 [Rhodococcus phage Grayson]|nr:hypothetical protein PBI_GRAYSON_254 [Rhodococcus phage Grayson]